jgi:peptidoglycan/xylan/chitin deacetylase (PgdA/CDA1 family)
MIVITYHAIAREESPVSISKERLCADLDALEDAGYTFVPLSAVSGLASSTRPPGSRRVALTFDDGYASVATDAWPVLEARRIPATLFVIGGRLGQDNRWAGQASWAPVMPLLDLGALRELATAGADIGGHTWSHPSLPSLDAARLDDEVRGAADRLEQIVRRPVRHFAYPYGHYGRRELAVAATRFDVAVTGDCRRADASTLHALGRLDAHDLHLARRLRLLDSSWLDTYLAGRRQVHRLRRTLG